MRRQYQPKFEYVAKEQQEPPPEPVQTQKAKKPYKKNYKKQIDPDYQREDEHQFDITKVKQKELTQTLIQVLKQKKIECMICINKLQHEASIWSCKQCYQPFHLSCIHKWIKNINPNPQNLFNWSCPKCNFQYQEKLPDYLCFCGKTKNPDTDKYSIPHSCQQKCQKKRGNYCPHPCPLDCHPGPCPECHVKDLVIQCHCGKSHQEKSCSDNTNSFFCNKKCQKLLNCGVHECQKNCHQGNCDPCLITKVIKCFCQTKEEEVLCSVKGLSCGNKCNKILDCGNHQCLENCHEECKPCQFNIAVVKTCPCGKVPIGQLIERKSCLDPIPSCGQIQEAVLNCGHKSKSICGQPFPTCVTKIKQKCRCQATERITTCDNKEQFICETVCKKKKSCKVHGCNMQCCPPNQDQLGGHLCLKVCNKPLKCGKHNCELFCHLGGCQNCPIVINQPIKCPCGKQQLNPPQRCGTEAPICFETCQKVMVCGHKCQNKCHPEDCPPCQEKVDKLCRCERHTISVPCYKIAICYDLCNKILKCGHKCQETCQATKECPANLEQNCGQKCQARRTCGHNCQETCHPDQPCPKLPCKTQMRVVCVCGNRDAFIECDAIDEPIERQLKCDQKCLNIKRFGAFYKTNNLVDIEKSYYPDVLLKYANYNLDALKKLELAIEKYLIESTPEERYDFSIQRNDWGELKKLALQILFSRHYKFEVQILRPYKNQYNISLIKTSDTVIPKVKLSEYYIKVQKGTIKRDHSPFKAKLTTVYDSLPMQDLQQFETFLFDFKNDYYIERQQNLLVINFWEIQQAEAVQKKLKRTVGLINVQWNLVINAQAVEEDDRVKAKTIEGDIIIKNKSQKPIQFYQDEDFIVQYTKQREQEFIDMRLNYHEVARLTKMCDNEEIERRIKEQQLSIFEQDSFYQYECIPKRDRMIREYCRIPKEPTPEYLRTPDTLIKTIDFLLYNFIDADIKEKDVKKPMDGDKIRNIKYEDIWEYINDRLLQVRYELTQIGYTIPFIKLIKFYVMSHSQLSDSRDNLKQLSILLSEFKNKQTYKFNLILECFGNTDINILQADIAQLELQDDSDIKSILELVIQVRSGQIDKFLIYYDQTDDDLIASFMHGFIFNIRQRVFDIILQSHINIAITDFVDRLKLTDWEETIDFLKDYGIDNKKIKHEIEQYRKWQAAKEQDSDNELPEPPIPIIQLQKPTLEPKQFYPLDIDRTLVYK